MKDKYKEKCPEMSYEVLDCRNMNDPKASFKIEDGTYDAVIDKACFDAILSGDSSGPNSDLFLKEIHRVLSPTGVYINISHGIPDQRTGYFTKKENFTWANNVTT